MAAFFRLILMDVFFDDKASKRMSFVGGWNLLGIYFGRHLSGKIDKKN